MCCYNRYTPEYSNAGDQLSLPYEFILNILLIILFYKVFLHGVNVSLLKMNRFFTNNYVVSVISSVINIQGWAGKITDALWRQLLRQHLYCSLKNCAKRINPQDSILGGICPFVKWRLENISNGRQCEIILKSKQKNSIKMVRQCTMNTEKKNNVDLRRQEWRGRPKKGGVDKKR